MRLFNEILVKAGMAKEMRLSDPNSIFRVAAQLNAARKTEPPSRRTQKPIHLTDQKLLVLSDRLVSSLERMERF